MHMRTYLDYACGFVSQDLQWFLLYFTDGCVSQVVFVCIEIFFLSFVKIAFNIRDVFLLLNKFFAFDKKLLVCFQTCSFVATNI